MENRSVEGGRFCLLLLLLLLQGGCATIAHQLHHVTGDAGSLLADEVVIERDRWGVPHVRARSDAAAAFGVAWAMAEDNYWQLEEGYIQALGRASYYYGERYLADDLVRAAFEVEALSRAEYEREPEPGKRILEGFAHGLNYYLRKQSPSPARVITRYEPWMVLARARQLAAEQRVGAVRLGAVALMVGENGAGSRPQAAVGTGAGWALAPGRSATGRALLLASVEGPFFGSDQQYELEVWSRTGWHVRGLARLGLPVPHVGHNERLGWAHAVSVPESGTARLLVFDHPTDSLAYRDGDGWARAEPWQDTLQVNTAAGVESRSYRFLRTRYGPLIAREGDTAWAVRLPELERGGALQQWQAQGRSGTVEEFTAALALGALPRLATAYADVAGNIMVHDPGAGAPVLNPGTGEVRIGGVRAVRAAAVDGGATVDTLARLALGASPAVRREEIELLVHEWEQVGGRDSRRAFVMDSAVDLLRHWDGRVSDGSSAATLHHVWQMVYHEEPEGGAGGPRAAGAFPRFRALEEAVARLRRDWGTAQVARSELVRLQRRHTSGEEVFRDDQPSSPVAGFPDGSFFVLNTVPGTGGRRYAVSGTAAVLATELVSPPRSRSVVVFGQRVQPEPGHFADQAVLYAAGELKDAGFGRGPVTERYHPGQRPRDGRSETAGR